MGEAIADCIGRGLCTRDDLFVTSKLWGNKAHPDIVAEACEKSALFCPP